MVIVVILFLLVGVYKILFILAMPTISTSIVNSKLISYGAQQLNTEGSAMDEQDALMAN